MILLLFIMQVDVKDKESKNQFAFIISCELLKVTHMHKRNRKQTQKTTYFFVTVFLPFTNFVDVDVDRKLAVP